MKWRALFILVLLLADAGCKINGAGDSNLVAYQTHIIAAFVVPDTLAPGDTAQFVCKIRDNNNTNSNFGFYWCIAKGTPIGAKDTVNDLFIGCPAYVTSQNQIKWKAPNKPDMYDFEVMVDDTISQYAPVDEPFSVIVKQ